MKPVSTHWKASLAKAASSYYEAGLGNARFQEYLTSRGITPQAAKAFRLGLVVEPHPGHEEMAGRMAIPYTTRTGVVTIRFRALNGEKKKYMALPGSLGRARPFNTRALLSDSPRIVICEGEIDTITAWMCGFQAVGFPGATNFNPNLHGELFEMREVVVSIDNDGKGDADERSGGREFFRRIESCVPGARGVVMPAGNDLNSYFVSNGRDAVRRLLEEGYEDEQEAI